MKLGKNNIFQKMRHGFTLMELLIVISVLALLMSILTPALQRARDSAMTVVCLSNYRQIGIASHMYLDDYNRLPRYWYNSSPLPNEDIGNQAWAKPMSQYLKVKKGEMYYGKDIYPVFSCPAYTTNYRDWSSRLILSGRQTYLYTVSSGIFSSGSSPPKRKDYYKFDDRLMLMYCGGSDGVADAVVWHVLVGYPDYLHKKRGGNILFADTHAEYVSHEDLEDNLTSVIQKTGKYLLYEGY